jgi:hypothetical protein
MMDGKVILLQQRCVYLLQNKKREKDKGINKGVCLFATE